MVLVFSHKSVFSGREPMEVVLLTSAIAAGDTQRLA
jgi:hypothetical protein